jgi:hypothetical protein
MLSYPHDVSQTYCSILHKLLTLTSDLSRLPHHRRQSSSNPILLWAPHCYWQEKQIKWLSWLNYHQSSLASMLSDFTLLQFACAAFSAMSYESRPESPCTSSVRTSSFQCLFGTLAAPFLISIARYLSRKTQHITIQK